MFRVQYLENYLSLSLQIWYAALNRECLAGAQIIFLESGRGLGHVTLQFLAVRSAILPTAWLLVHCDSEYSLKFGMFIPVIEQVDSIHRFTL